MILTLTLIAAAFLAGAVVGILAKVAVTIQIQDRRAVQAHGRLLAARVLDDAETETARR